MEPSKPCLPEYDRHIFVCVGEKCHPSEGLPLYEHLKEQLKKSKSDPTLKRVMRSQSKCLGVCQGGPVAVVYPEGVWYGHMTPQKMDRVLNEHLKEGKIVDEWVFYSQSSGEGGTRVPK